MLDTSILSREITERVPEALIPEINVIEDGDTYGKFAFEPLERGYGITIGNPMRRMLLSAVEGTAITWVKIDGTLHEYSIVPHMKEEVMEFLLNVKGIRIRSVTGRPGKMRLEITGQGRVCAGDIATSADFEIANPEFHLATLDSDDANLSVEFNVDHGKGYQPVAQGDGLPSPLMGVLPVDAIFNPVRKVNYTIERTRVGQVTDYERLVLEMWTDGTITPVEALRKSSQVLVDHLFHFSSLGHEIRSGADRPSIKISPEVYQSLVEKLGLSPRTLNCMKRAHISKVGQVLEMTNTELLKIKNFGERSLEELMTKLRDEDMLSDEEWASRREGSQARRHPKDEEEIALEDGQEQPPQDTGDESVGHVQDQVEEESDVPELEEERPSAMTEEEGESQG